MAWPSDRIGALIVAGRCSSQQKACGQLEDPPGLLADRAANESALRTISPVVCKIDGLTAPVGLIPTWNAIDSGRDRSVVWTDEFAFLKSSLPGRDSEVDLF